MGEVLAVRAFGEDGTSNAWGDARQGGGGRSGTLWRSSDAQFRQSLFGIVGTANFSAYPFGASSAVAHKVDGEQEHTGRRDECVTAGEQDVEDQRCDEKDRIPFEREAE